MTDPLQKLDLSTLSPFDKLTIEGLRAAYDRAGPRGVAEGMAELAKSNPDLFGWLLKRLTE